MANGAGFDYIVCCVDVKSPTLEAKIDNAPGKPLSASFLDTRDKNHPGPFLDVLSMLSKEGWDTLTTTYTDLWKGDGGKYLIVLLRRPA